MSKRYLYSSIVQIRYVIIRIIVDSARASQKDWEIEPSDLWPMNRNTLVLYIYILGNLFAITQTSMKNEVCE